jgi:hypothetical protein
MQATHASSQRNSRFVVLLDCEPARVSSACGSLTLASRGRRVPLLHNGVLSIRHRLLVRCLCRSTPLQRSSRTLAAGLLRIASSRFPSRRDRVAVDQVTLFVLDSQLAATLIRNDLMDAVDRPLLRIGVGAGLFDVDDLAVLNHDNRLAGSVGRSARGVSAG